MARTKKTKLEEKLGSESPGPQKSPHRRAVVYLLASPCRRPPTAAGVSMLERPLRALADPVYRSFFNGLLAGSNRHGWLGAVFSRRRVEIDADYDEGLDHRRLVSHSEERDDIDEYVLER